LCDVEAAILKLLDRIVVVGVHRHLAILIRTPLIPAEDFQVRRNRCALSRRSCLAYGISSSVTDIKLAGTRGKARALVARPTGVDGALGVRYRVAVSATPGTVRCVLLCNGRSSHGR